MYKTEVLEIDLNDFRADGLETSRVEDVIASGVEVDANFYETTEGFEYWGRSCSRTVVEPEIEVETDKVVFLNATIEDAEQLDLIFNECGFPMRGYWSPKDSEYEYNIAIHIVCEDGQLVGLIDPQILDFDWR